MCSAWRGMVSVPLLSENLPMARRVPASPDLARPGTARHGVAGMVGLGPASPCSAGRGMAGLARLGQARRNQAWFASAGTPGLVSASDGAARQERPGTVCRGGVLTWQAGDGTVALVPAAVRLGAAWSGRRGQSWQVRVRLVSAWLGAVGQACLGKAWCGPARSGSTVGDLAEGLGAVA